MKRIIDTSEVLGTVETPQGLCELCATADARFDESTPRLTVILGAYLRTTDLRTKEQRVSADWLPKSETVAESVGLEEADEVARDVFHRWVRKVKESIPALLINKRKAEYATEIHSGLHDQVPKTCAT